MYRRHRWIPAGKKNHCIASIAAVIAAIPGDISLEDAAAIGGCYEPTCEKTLDATRYKFDHMHELLTGCMVHSLITRLAEWRRGDTAWWSVSGRIQHQ